MWLFKRKHHSGMDNTDVGHTPVWKPIDVKCRSVSDEDRTYLCETQVFRALWWDFKMWKRLCWLKWIKRMRSFTFNTLHIIIHQISERPYRYFHLFTRFSAPSPPLFGFQCVFGYAVWGATWRSSCVKRTRAEGTLYSLIISALIIGNFQSIITVKY